MAVMSVAMKIELVDPHLRSKVSTTSVMHARVSITCTIIACMHALRHPFPTPDASAPIAPDLLMSAGEAGIDAADFGDDVAAFLEGGVDAKSLARQRSVKQPQRAASKPAADTDPFAGLELPSADIGNDGY
eukprot:TRINITY_DN7120_c0_g1_i2.p1 TRINITY_DN7120_c0_g1~~TRINITY_DN7120_c0_g1_i2.p1  ORF type:complete len:131 (+),score=32.36 TRINITY_DN7120_c0_g1_i2:427-819(+)